MASQLEKCLSHVTELYGGLKIEETPAVRCLVAPNCRWVGGYEEILLHCQQCHADSIWMTGEKVDYCINYLHMSTVCKSLFSLIIVKTFLSHYSCYGKMSYWGMSITLSLINSTGLIICFVFSNIYTLWSSVSQFLPIIIIVYLLQLRPIII